MGLTLLCSKECGIKFLGTFLFIESLNANLLSRDMYCPFLIEGKEKETFEA